MTTYKAIKYLLHWAWKHFDNVTSVGLRPIEITTTIIIINAETFLGKYSTVRQKALNRTVLDCVWTGF